MNNFQLYQKTSYGMSQLITRNYSTSFSLGIRLMNRKFHDPIYAVYGFVRLADEIVDTFHQHNKKELLEKFTNDTYAAIADGISLNPVLNSFQEVVNQYQINQELIATFLKSMEMDLSKIDFDTENYDQYILGSAEVVGLMCLKIFCEGDEKKYELLKHPAMKLGAAFQKINFLRDVQADYVQLGRSYFPGVEIEKLNDCTKRKIEADIEKDFREGMQGILQLPVGARVGVYIAYVYYYALFKKIKTVSASRILHERIRIPDFQKYVLMMQCYFRHSFNLI